MLKLAQLRLYHHGGITITLWSLSAQHERDREAGVFGRKVIKLIAFTIQE